MKKKIIKKIPNQFWITFCDAQKSRKKEFNTFTYLGLSSHKVWLFQCLLLLKSCWDKVFVCVGRWIEQTAVRNRNNKNSVSVKLYYLPSLNLLNYLREILWTKLERKNNNNTGSCTLLPVGQIYFETAKEMQSCDKSFSSRKNFYFYFYFFGHLL